MKQEFVQVPVEVVRELKRTVGKWDDDLSANSKSLANHMAACIRGLPDPPKPDVVEECARIHLERDGMNDWDKCMVRSHLKADMLAALKKYRAMGCPELDE